MNPWRLSKACAGRGPPQDVSGEEFKGTIGTYISQALSSVMSGQVQNTAGEGKPADFDNTVFTCGGPPPPPLPRPRAAAASQRLENAESVSWSHAEVASETDGLPPHHSRAERHSARDSPCVGAVAHCWPWWWRDWRRYGGEKVSQRDIQRLLSFEKVVKKTLDKAESQVEEA